MTAQAQGRTASLMALHSEAHKDSILSKFDKLRKKDFLCDITLIVEDVHFKAHKALLAASSDYFSIMFKEEAQISQSTYRLDVMMAKTFAAVLEFIYSARVSVEESCTEPLLDMARLLGIDDLVKALLELNTTKPAMDLGHDQVDSDNAGGLDRPKRKRGRPRKNVSEASQDKCITEKKPSDTLKEGKIMSGSTVDSINSPVMMESQPNECCHADYDPRTDYSRQSRRKIRPPSKYKGYKVGIDPAASKEPGRRRGRTRKTPNTEARCEDCGKVFKKHLFLKIHQRTHTGEKPFRCSVCGKGFTQKHSLLVHQRMHTGEKPFVCSVCSKALSTKHSLHEHMNLHEEQKLFNCDKCGKTFTQRRQLKSHYRVHTGKSLPECDICHHKFMDTAQLKKHLRTHTGEKPFTCEICGKCFTAKSTLQTHIRIHRGEKPYDCHVCRKSFSDPSARRRHVASHSGRKSFTCSVCSISFTRLDNLKTHAKTHSRERLSPSQDPPPPSEAHGLLHPYQLPSGSEQEIQLVVTDSNVDFVASQEQVSMLPTEQSQPRLTLMAQPAGHSPHMQTISVLESHPEQMHVITLSKEAMEHLQAHNGPPQEQADREQHCQAIHINSQSNQAISISQTSGQISSHHIQGQTFQIQAGTVSYLYTTSLPQES